MSLASRVVLASAFSLKRGTHSALSRFELHGPRTHLRDHTVSLMVLSLEREGVLYEPSCSVLRLLAQGETHTDLVLAIKIQGRI